MAQLYARLDKALGTGVLGLIGFLALVFVAFSLASPQFLSAANFNSMAFQLPELGLLTLAMLMPIISGGFNLAIIYTANISGLTLAWILNQNGGVNASLPVFLLGSAAAIAVGALSGAIMGVVIAYVGAHPILVSLAMMIFLRGLGEFLTKGGDISGFPDFLHGIGHGFILGLPAPLLVFAVAALAWHVLLTRTRHGLSVYMIGSNIKAASYSGLHTKRTLTLIYTLSGAMCAHRRHPDADEVQLGPGRPWRGAVAGDGAGLLPGRRRSVRRLWPRGAGCPCPDHPAGALVRPQSSRRQPASLHRRLGPVPDRRDDHSLSGRKLSKRSTHEGITSCKALACTRACGR